MNLDPASNSRASSLGSFALVTYLPEPLGSFLTSLRQFLPGESGAAEAHITFLPPRLLAHPLEVASEEVARVLHSVTEFELELGAVRRFPRTDVLYLEVQAGREQVRRLHDSLNQGWLSGTENFEYIPHLTLGGPFKPDSLKAILQQTEEAWKSSGLSPRFVVKEIVLLWQPTEKSSLGHDFGREWTRVSTYPLQSRSANYATTRT